MADEQTIEQPEVQTPDGGGIPQPSLNDSQRKELHSIVTKMILNKEPEENIKLVIDHYTKQSLGGTKITTAPTAAATTSAPKSAPFEGSPDLSNPLNITTDKAPSPQQDHQLKVDAANQRIQGELKNIDPAVKRLLTDYKKQNEAAQIQDQIHQRGGDITSDNSALVRAQHLIPAAAIKVSPDEVEAYKAQMQKDPALAREALYEHAKLNPDKAKQISSDVYLLDSKDRAQGKNINQIQENAKGIENGDLDYSTWHGGNVTKPLGLVGSLVHGFNQRESQFKDYNLLANSSDKDIIDEYEKRRNTPHNADEPIPTPKGLSGGFGQMAGSEGITMAKGALPSVLAAGTGGAAEVAAPWVGSLVTSPDFYERGYANSFNENYNNLRDEGKTAEDALKTAKDRAAFDARADVALGITMTAMGGKAGLGINKAEFSPGFLGAVKGVAKKIVESTPEAAALGTAGGGVQALKNINAGKSAGEGVPESFLTMAGLHLGISAIAAGAKAVKPDLYKSAVDNMAKQPDDAVNKAIAEKVESGEITPQQANDAHIIIEDKRAQHEDLLNQAKDIVAKGKIQGTSTEPMQHAAQNDPEKFTEYLQNIADKAHDKKTAEHTSEVYGEDLANVAKQLFPKENISSLKIENNGNETEAQAETNEVGAKGAEPSEPAPFSNQQKEAAAGFLKQGIEAGEIPKEYEGMGEHPEHLLNYIKEEIGKGKETDMEKEFGKDLVGLSKSEVSYPIVRGIKPKVGTFTTESGSTYEIKGNTTTRNKADRPGNEPGDIGQKETSKNTVYVSPEDLGKAQEVYLQGGEKKVEQTGNKVRITTEVNGKQRITEFDVNHIPKEGDHPLEFFHDGGVHLGSKINNLKFNNNATGIESPTTLDVRQQAGNGEEVGSRNAGHQEPSPESQAENKDQGQEEKLDPYGLPFEDESGDKRSGIKNAISNPTRFERGLPKVDVPKLGSDTQVLAEGKELVDSGKINPREVVARINSTNEGMHPEEAKAMQYYMHQLSAHENTLREGLADATEPTQKAEINSHLQQLSDEVDAATEANIKSGKAWSDVGNIRQIVTDAGFNPSREMAVIKDAYGGKIPPEIKAKLDAAIKERDEAIEARLKAEERLKNTAAEKTLDKAKEAVEKEEKKTGKQKKEQIREDRKGIIDELKAAIKKDTSSGYAVPFPTNTIPVIGKLAVSYFKEGYVNLDELVSKVFEDIKAHFPNATKKDVRDAISQYDPLRDYAKQTSKEKLGRKETTLNKKLASGDILDKKTNPSLNFEKDSEWMKANQKAINAEYKLKQTKRTAFESKKNMYEKGLMWAGRAVRLSVLSGYNVLGKLASAATIGGAAKRIPEQAIGKLYSGIFKGIAEKAPIEGMANIAAEAKFYKEFFNPIKFGKNAMEILRSGSSPLSKKFSGAEYEHVPGLYLPTDLHQIIKDPLKRGTFESSFINGLAWAEKNGMDTNDPLVIQSIETAAYKRAQYEIFQEQNALTKTFGKWKANMENNGNVGATGKFLADFLVPVSTVPTNIVKRLGSTSPLGLIRGGVKVVQAYRNGIENLSNEEADAVMRQLKQGTLGTALWLTGWFGASHFGGLYSKFNPDKKRAEGDFVSNEMEINGKMIPKPVQHALPLEIMQLAATMRRIHDNYIGKKDENEITATTKAALGAIGAAIEQIPVLETGAHLYGAFNNPYEAGKLKEDIQRRFEPQILKETGIIKDTKPITVKTGGSKRGVKKEHRH